MIHWLALLANLFRALSATTVAVRSGLGWLGGNYSSVVFGNLTLFKTHYYLAPFLSLICIGVIFYDETESSWGYSHVYFLLSSLGLSSLSLVLAYLLFDMPDEGVERHFGDPARAILLLTLICAITLLDVSQVFRTLPARSPPPSLSTPLCAPPW